MISQATVDRIDADIEKKHWNNAIIDGISALLSYLLGRSTYADRHILLEELIALRIALDVVIGKLEDAEQLNPIEFSAEGWGRLRQAAKLEE